MPRGRPKKPAAVKELTGNPGKRKINHGPAVTHRPKPPSSLNPGALAVWKRLVAVMPDAVYLASDEAVMAEYCIVTAQLRQCDADTAKNGLYSPGSAGQLAIAPWVKLAISLRPQLISLAQRLGLDPISRQNIESPEADEEEDFDIE